LGFEIPGEENLDFLESMRKPQGKIKLVLVRRNEQATGLDDFVAERRLCELGRKLGRRQTRSRIRHVRPVYDGASVLSAMRSDALQSSHPIHVRIHHAEEVEQVFDAISYCNGGSVVRMIKAVPGMNTFNYMKKYECGNTETIDLWTAWEEVSRMPVNESSDG
jgi:aminopeptidase N